MRAKVVWGLLGLLVASLITPLIIISPAAAADSFVWVGSSQLKNNATSETFSGFGKCEFAGDGLCASFFYGHTGAHPSNCNAGNIPNQYKDVAWPATINKIVEVQDDGTGSAVDLTAKNVTLYTITGASGGKCTISTATVPINNGSSTNPTATADYAYTDPTTIRQIYNGNTYKQSSDKTVFILSFGTTSVKCADYIKLASAGATTGTLHTANDSNASSCTYDNVTNGDGIKGPLAVTITKTAPSNIPTDPHATDPTAADSCKVDPNTTMRWLVCDLLALGSGAIETIDRIIQNFLYTPTDQVFSSELKTAWNSFRVVGVVLVLIAGLVMVISQAAGFELFDAYTVKKLLPRLIVAAIGISLSWPLMKFAVTFFNDIGGWTHDIILYPFKDLTNYATGATYLGAILLIAALPIIFLALGPVASIALLGTIILAILVSVLVLSIRQIVILMTVVMAPLAIAAYVLPGTQKLWTFWKDTFLTTMLMFPIIMGFIAAGQALALVAASVKNSPLMQLLSVMAYIAPYFLLPFAFKLAGGLMATIFSIANDRNRGAFDRLKKMRQEGGAQHRERTYGRQMLQKRGDWAAGLQERSSKSNSAFRRSAMRGLSRGVAGYNVEAQMSGRRAAVAKEIGDQIATGVDDEVRGLTAVGDVYTNSSGQRSYKTLGGAEVSEAAVLRGRQRWGNDSFAQQAALSYEMRKASDEGESQGLAENYMEYAKGLGMSDRQATGNWIGAAFENQNQHLEYKNMRARSVRDPVTNKTKQVMAMAPSGYDGFVKEVYEKKGSYPLAQMASNTIEELKNAHTNAGEIISTGQIFDGKLNNGQGGMRAANAEDISTARDRQQKIQGIAETFMHSYGGRGPTGEVEDPSTAGGSRQASTPGAAHVAERVRELAELTGVYGTAPSGPYTELGHAPSPNRREQS